MSRLTKIQKGPQEAPWSLVIQGADGVGKTQFGLACPAPIFLKLESKDDELDDHKYMPETWEDALGFCDDLTGAHDYQTFVVDTVDWLNDLVEAHVVKKNNWTSMQDKKAEFGRGTDALLDEWRIFLSKLEQLRIKRKMNILLLAHTEIRRFSDPDAAIGDYDRFEIKMPKKIASQIREWSKAVFFACFETTTVGEWKKKGQSTGRRIMHTERRAGFDAKNIWGLPPMLPLSFSEFEEKRKGVSEALATEFAQRRDSLNEEQRKAFDEWWSKQSNKQVAMAQAVQHWKSKEAA